MSSLVRSWRRPRLRHVFTPAGMLRHAVLWVACAGAALPLYFMLVTSLKSKDEYLVNMWGLPRHPSLANFSAALSDGRLMGWMWNSVFVTVFSVGICTLLSALAAYPLARMRFPGRDTVLNIFIALMVIPPVVLIIPLFVMMVNINLVNTYWSAIIIYSGLMIPFSVYLLTNFFRTVPAEIIDAATIDGCSQFRTFTAIILPLSGPALITLIIVTGALIATVPMLLVYAFGQRFFVRGLVAGAVK